MTSKLFGIWDEAFARQAVTEDGYPENWEMVHSDKEPFKHDITSVSEVYREKGTDNAVCVNYHTSYNYGVDEYSFYICRVYPHVVTTVEYKGRPQPPQGLPL